MTAKKGNATLDAFIASGTAADAARVIGVDGKRFRSHLRSKLGAFASKGNGWQTLDANARTAVYETYASKVSK